MEPVEDWKSKSTPGNKGIPSLMWMRWGCFVNKCQEKHQPERGKIEVGECLLLFGAESFFLQFAIQKFEVLHGCENGCSR
jgi:hypothetical protein